MLTLVVFFITFLFLPITPQALYFLPGSHRIDVSLAASTGGTITLDPPTRIVERQVNPSSTLKPIISIPYANVSSWANQTNQLCMDAIDITTVTNPAGVVPCYNVLAFDPNTGMFLSEVRLFQVVSMMQLPVMASATGSGVLFEFPHAQINGSPGENTIANMFAKRGMKSEKRQVPSMGRVIPVDAFYMNGTADITQGISMKQLLTPTTATLNLNISSTITPFSMTNTMVMFVNGLFSPTFTVPSSNTTSSTASSTAATGFVLPGITFGITPIGFYIFSVYWGVFTAFILWGAWNKRKYREAFRRRRAAVLNFTSGKSSRF